MLLKISHFLESIFAHVGLRLCSKHEDLMKILHFMPQGIARAISMNFISV